jgi:hypothetical protein
MVILIVAIVLIVILVLGRGPFHPFIGFDGLTGTPILHRFFPFGFVGLWGVIQIALAIWVGIDATRKGLSGVLWGLLVLFTSLVGLIVYLLVSPSLAAQSAESRAAGPARPPTSTHPPVGSGPPGAVEAAAPRPPGSAAPPAASTPAARATGSHCPECNAEIAIDFKICPNCGASLPRCSNCERPIQKGWKHCPYCGTPIAE